MNFSISKKTLLAELTPLLGIVERKTTIPILNNVLLKVEGSTLRLSATDLDVSLVNSLTLDSLVSEPGGICVEAKRLADIVASISDEEISFSTDGDWLVIKCGRSVFKLVTHAVEHYPAIASVKDQMATIKAESLAQLIGRTIYAITQEESRYALGGALFTVFNAGTKAQMVTTDGHRLALASAPIEGKDDINVIIPRKALVSLQALTGANPETSVEFALDENHMQFTVGSRRLVSRMLAGQFPNYDMVIPKNCDQHITLKSDDIARPLRRALLMADERSHSVKFTLNGNLSLSSQTADIGEAQDVIETDYKGEEMTFRFNGMYVLDFLGTADEFTMEFTGAKTPVIFRAGDDYKAIIMPMQL